MPDFGRWSGNGGDPSLNEINRTDQLLDALANQQPVYATDPGEAELAQLLAGWRDEVRTPPLMAPVTPRDATHALRRAVEARKRTRTSMAVVGSVAAAVLCIGGFGAVVAGAGPGDALYGLHTMLFGEQEKTRTDQVALASQQLAEVKQLIDEGQWDAAQDKLQTLTTTVATVNDVEQKQELVTQWQELTVKVDAKDANASLPPGAPPPPMPEPVVVAPGSDTSTSSSTSTSSGRAAPPRRRRRPPPRRPRLPLLRHRPPPARRRRVRLCPNSHRRAAPRRPLRHRRQRPRRQRRRPTRSRRPRPPRRPPRPRVAAMRKLSRHQVWPRRRVWPRRLRLWLRQRVRPHRLRRWLRRRQPSRLRPRSPQRRRGSTRLRVR